MKAVTVGCFDLLHRGHRNLLAAASVLSSDGTVTVGLHSDRSIALLKGRPPVDPWDERARRLVTTPWVTDVQEVDSTDPSMWLGGLVDDGRWVFVRGDDMPRFPGRGTVEAAGVPVVLVTYTAGVSTTILRQTQGLL